MTQRFFFIPSLFLLSALSTACMVDIGQDDDGFSDDSGVPGDGGNPSDVGGPGSGGTEDGGNNPGTGSDTGMNTGGNGVIDPGNPGGGTGGATTGSGGGDQGPGPGKPTLPDGRGASVHFVTYEAEDMTTNGAAFGPTRTFSQVAAEASGRRAVRLSSQGHQVEFTNQSPSNSIVVRYSIPDGGLNHWTTLTVLVNGAFRAKLDLTSRYSWSYGAENQFNQPAQKTCCTRPHHFFDETRALIGDIPVGATVTVRKDTGDNAAHYDIDLVEMEQVPPPLPKPQGFLDLVTDCGATPNDSTDDTDALQDCIDRGQATGVYIPPGVFRSNWANNNGSNHISVGNVTIRGAGMWHSTFAGKVRFNCWGNNCRYSDFSVFGDTTSRVDNDPENAFTNNDGSSGIVLENIWIEHVKVGFWTGARTEGLRISNCRMRNLHADGINLYGGTSNSIVENSHFRNTGDDALAIWSHSGGSRPTGQNNIFRHLYVQIPWKANCFGIYGGSDNKIEDSVCSDVVQYPGILFARQFDSHAYGGMNRIDRTTLIRAGGRAYNQDQGALKLHAAQGPVQHLTVTNLDIIDSTYAAVHVQGGNVIDNVWLNGVNIQNSGSNSFRVDGNAVGALDAVNVVATGGSTQVSYGNGHNFNLIKGPGSSGW